MMSIRRLFDPYNNNKFSNKLHHEPSGIRYWFKSSGKYLFRYFATVFALISVGALLYYFLFSNIVGDNPFSRKHPAEQELRAVDPLDQVLMRAAMPDRTVIILCPLNKAWIEKDSMFDMFLESFRIGNQTAELLKHMVVAAYDNEAFDHCLRLNMSLSCYNLTDQEGANLSNEARFGTPNYFQIVWKKVGFLSDVLEKGYNFIYTDADVMWFRNPLLGFLPDAEFQISSDVYLPGQMTDNANTGLIYVKSSERTIAFLRFWYALRVNYSSVSNDQAVFRNIMHDPFLKEIGLEIKCLDTVFLGGFCQPYIDLRLVYTVHANCCIGLPDKLHDLRILLDDWKKYISLPDEIRNLNFPGVSVPQICGWKGNR